MLSKLEPRNRAAALRAGVAWLRLGRLPEAVRCLELAVELDPERAEALRPRGRADALGPAPTRRSHTGWS